MKRKLIFLMSLFVMASLVTTNPVLADAWGPAKTSVPQKRASQQKTKIPSPPSSRKPIPSAQKKADGIEDQLRNDPESMSKIEKLRDNPALQKILQDPELMKAIREKNLARIVSDPKIKALESSKVLQELLKQNQ